MDINPKTRQILELSDKDYKVAIVIIIQDVRKDTFEVNRKYFKKKQTER